MQDQGVTSSINFYSVLQILPIVSESLAASKLNSCVCVCVCV